MRIFLGSSRESLALLRRVASWVEACGHIPIRWDQPGTFTAGNYTLAALRNLARSVDGAIFIFAEDDQVWYRKDKLSQPRDNVLVEYGLFADALGEQRVAICRSGNPKTAADLLGITYIDLEKTSLVRAEMAIEEWLTSIAPVLGIDRMKILMSPFQALGKPSLFRKGTELVSSAKRRLALVAKTPIILMGPRPYNDAYDPISYENDQDKAYWKVINGDSTGGVAEFICVASRPCMLKELANHRDTSFPDKVRERYIALDQRSSDLGHRPRVRLAWHQDSSPMTFLVSDDEFMIWFKSGDGDNVWITANDEIVASALYSQARDAADNQGAVNFLRDVERLA